MSTGSPAVTPSLLTLATVPDPTAQWGAPAVKVQIQNASAFVLTVSVGGEQYTIQSFTAQTIDTGGTGASLTLLPTSGPAGAQGSIIAVWLLAGQDPDMADGQLTGAAQYAQGLGSTLFGPTNLTAAGGLITIPSVAVPPTVRTLLITTAQVNIVGSISNVAVTGNVTGQSYYNQAPYLLGNLNGSFFVVVPIATIIDTSVKVVLTVATGQIEKVTVAGDTALYDESVFYNGVAQASTVAAAGTIKSGPFRLISVNAFSGGTGAIALSSGGNLLVTTAGGQVQQQSFPPGLIVPTGVSVNASGAVGQSSVVWAYP